MSAERRALLLATLLTAVLASAAFPARAHAANGCGPAGLGFAVPDRPLGFDFGPACAAHDACYTTAWALRGASPSAARFGCDLEFLHALRDACFDRAAGRLDTCLRVAALYHGAVRGWLGALAYGRAQP